MSNLQQLTSEEMSRHNITIYEPFAEFLQADPAEFKFQLNLLDAVRFAGHACPSMIGAFITTRKAVELLFEDAVCIRGDLEVSTSASAEQGPIGPICNVFSFITGAFEKTGFGGLAGEKFVRRHLLRFEDAAVPQGAFRFKRISTGQAYDIYYMPAELDLEIDAELPFQQQWRVKINAILKNVESVLRVEKCSRQI